MFLKFYGVALRALQAVVPALMLLGMPPGLAQAALNRLTVITGDDRAASTEFIQQLRDAQAPGARLQVVRLPADGARTGAARPEEDRNGNGPGDALTVAVGAGAARSAIDSDSREPLLLTMLTRLEYESLKDSPGLRREGRRVGVLLCDPSMADQLALVDAALPQRRRLGVVTTGESQPLVAELERAAGRQWALHVATAPDAKSLAGALRGVLPGSDALLVLPDAIGSDQAATLAVLHAAAGAGLPVFGASEGMVRSGGLAAAVSTPALMARQAQAMGQKVAIGPAGVLVESARPATVRVNANVARGLGLRLPDERELTERVAAPR